MGKMLRPYSPVRFYLPNIILGVLILLIMIVLSTALIFRVEDVKVSGSTIYSDALIEDMVLNDKYKKNGLYDVIKNTLFPRKDVPFVESLKVGLDGVHTLTITVREKKLTGYLIDKEERYVYFDSDVKVTQVSDQLVDGLIPVEGLTVEGAVEGKDLPVSGTRRNALTTIYKNITTREIDVKKITFDESDGTIGLDCGNIKVMLGNKSKLEEKLRRLSYILPKLKKKSGTLHLEDFSDENTDVVFKED